MQIARSADRDIVPAVAASLLTVAVTALYLYVISKQGDAGESRPRLVAMTLLVASLSLVSAAAVRARPVRLLLLCVGSFTLVVWAILGSLSIGVLLVPGAVLGLVAASRAAHGVPAAQAYVTALLAAAIAVLLTAVVLGSS